MSESYNLFILTSFGKSKNHYGFLKHAKIL